MENRQILSPHEACRLLGGEVYGNRLRCPGPRHSKNDRSLEVWFKPDTPEGFLVHSFANDDPFVCRDYVRQVLGLESWEPRRWAGATRVHPIMASAPEPPRDTVAQAWRWWGRTVDAHKTLTDGYLQSRGLVLTPDLTAMIRHHRSRCAMVALLRDIHTDEPCGVHCTFLDGAARSIGRCSVEPRAPLLSSTPMRK
jgi:putative DNA primase/helicase